MTDLVASLLVVGSVATVELVQALLWPRRSLRPAVVALSLLLTAITYGLLWDRPGPAAVVLAMVAAGHLVRTLDAVLSFPEATRRQFALFLLFLLRHPTQDRRPEPSASPRLRLARGLALLVLGLGLVALSRRLRLWTWAPYLDDLLMGVELGCLFLAGVELISPLARALGLRELLLFVDGLGPDFAWSPSLRVFWSGRWNHPVANMLRRALFLPVGGREHPARGALFVFLVSGVMHGAPLLLAGPDRVLWAWLGAGAVTFFVIHGLAVVGEGALPWRLRRGPLGRALVYGAFLLTLPLYPAPLFQVLGLHGRPVESLTPVVLARALGAT